jgi:hypothetical protein
MDSTKKIHYAIFSLGCVAYLSHIMHGMGMIRGCVNDFAFYSYLSVTGLMLLFMPFILYRVYHPGVIEGIFLELFNIDTNDFNPDHLPAIRKKINIKIFIGEGQVLFYAYIALAIFCLLNGANGLCQMTLVIIICNRILALCFKSLLIDVLKDLDLAEKRGVWIEEEDV